MPLINVSWPAKNGPLMRNKEATAMKEKAIAVRIAVLALLIGILFSRSPSSMSASARRELGTLNAQVNGTWEFDEEGVTAGCVGTAPGSQGNGPYKSSFSLWVEQNGNTITGSGYCEDVNHPIYLGGTVSGTTVLFRRYGPGCTPGYTVDWDYSGVIQDDNITGTFSGGGDPQDPYAEGCMTGGTFTILFPKLIYFPIIIKNTL